MIELLVVLGIVAVLMGLLLVAIQKVRQAAARARCGNNLHNLGIAFHHWKTVFGRKSFPTANWVAATTAYVEQADTFYRCPLQEQQFNADGVGAVYIRVMSSDGRAPVVFSEYGDNIIPLNKSGARVRQSGRAATTPAWYAVFELSGIADWDDVVLLIEPQPQGTIKVTYAFGDDGGARTTTVNGYQLDILDENKNPIAINLTYQQSCFVPGSIKNILSYGINSRAHHMGVGDSRKLLLLEYNAPVANVVWPFATNSDIANFGALVAPRHNGTLIALFFDGHVETQTVDAIDARIGSVQKDLWMPIADFE